jgi:uncharacterized tellurite resistance protein B-like protein
MEDYLTKSHNDSDELSTLSSENREGLILALWEIAEAKSHSTDIPHI